MRARHLEALAVVFDRYAQQLSGLAKPYQLWIYLDATDSSLDAVYVHSPNPNHEHFPLMLEEAQWDVPELAQYFEALLPGHHLRAGRWGNTAYYIYSADVGLPLAP